MLRCRNCNGPVDSGAVSCPRCGRPNAGEEARRVRSRGNLVAFVAVLGFLTYSWIASDGTAGAPPPQVPSDTSLALSPQELHSAASGHREETDQGSVAQVGSITHDAPLEQQKTEIAETSRNVDIFQHEATLEDRRGKIVLQSRASMASRNVAVLASGTPVQAESKGGRWVRVQTSDGQVGFVRGRQLDYTSPSDAAIDDLANDKG